MRVFIINTPETEIDIALAKFKKLKVVVEVKWKEKITNKDLKQVEEKLERFRGCRKILIVPNKTIDSKKLEIWDVKKILKIIRSTARHI